MCQIHLHIQESLAITGDININYTISIVKSNRNVGSCYLNSVHLSCTQFVGNKVYVKKKTIKILSEEKMRAEWGIKYLFFQFLW